MKIIKGISPRQMQFISLDDLVVADNPVRIIDAFAEKLDIKHLGIAPHHSKQQTHPGRGPGLMISCC